MGEGYISDKDYFADADGKLSSKAQSGSTIVAVKGALITAATAAQYGISTDGLRTSAEALVEQDAKNVATLTNAVVTAKAFTHAPETKAVPGPDATK